MVTNYTMVHLLTIETNKGTKRDLCLRLNVCDDAKAGHEINQVLAQDLTVGKDGPIFGRQTSLLEGLQNRLGGFVPDGMHLCTQACQKCSPRSALSPQASGDEEQERVPKR